jgi:hypothetical protein
MNRSHTLLVAGLLVCTCGQPPGLSPAERYAVELVPARHVWCLAEDFQAQIYVTNLTPDTMVFNFRNSGQYAAVFYNTYNQVVLYSPSIVYCLQTAFIIPPFGTHTMELIVPLRNASGGAPVLGLCRIRTHIPYNEYPYSETWITITP